MNTIREYAYAKINLTLDVFERRPDGYHDIASIFQAISVADIVGLTVTDRPGEISILVDGPEAQGVPADPANLAAKAARAILKAIAPDCGAQIRVEKRIPAQSGLGGGSSDAAAVLRAVCRAFDFDAGSALVAEVAAGLGADVPFFLVGGTARVTGLGEKVEPMDGALPMSLVIARPDVGVSTAAAYGALDDVPNRISGRFTQRWPDGGMGNDFEPVIYRDYPAVAAVRDALTAAGCEPVRLCGSGSALFGVTERPESTRDRLSEAGIRAWAASTVPREIMHAPAG